MVIGELKASMCNLCLQPHTKRKSPTKKKARVRTLRIAANTDINQLVDGSNAHIDVILGEDMTSDPHRSLIERLDKVDEIW